MSNSNDHAGFSFQISETPPPARAGTKTPLADLVLDMGDFGQAADPSPLPPSEEAPPRIARAAEPIRLEKPIELEEQIAHPPKASEIAELKPDSTVSPAPRIKRISFPAAKGKSPAHLKAREEPPHPSRTKFSKSISAQKLRPALDSEPDAEPQSRTLAEQVEMAPPEDLPGVEQELLPEGGNVSWGSDTPSARDIWKKARTSWHAASRHAAALRGQGLRASKALAETMNEKVREHLRDASEQRAHRAHLQSEKEGAPSEALPTSAPLRTEPSSPPMAGRVILGLARSAGRKVAAPASALAAAALVYVAGSHLLGADASVALSRAVKGPEVPELGSLNAAKEPAESEKSSTNEPSSGEKAPRSGKASASGPPPMETEITEMPEGMSWPGKGLIEVVTSKDELVYVDGVFTGRGPLRRIPVSPGEHEVSIRADGKERKGSVEVEADKNTRAVFKGE